MSNVDDFRSRVNIKMEPRRPPIIKNGLLVLVPSEERAKSIGIIEITHGARTESIPETSEINKSATARYLGFQAPFERFYFYHSQPILHVGRRSMKLKQRLTAKSRHIFFEGLLNYRSLL